MCEKKMANSQPPKHKRKQVIILSGLVLLVAISAALFLYFHSSTPAPQTIANPVVNNGEEDEKKEDVRLADPRIAKLVNEHTKNTTWKLSDTPNASHKENRVNHINDELTIRISQNWILLQMETLVLCYLASIVNA